MPDDPRTSRRPDDPQANSQPDSQADQRLVDRANKGDADALGDMYRAHRNWCFRVACRFTHDPALADDAVHEAFMHLATRFPGFKLRGRLTTFLYPVVKNRAREQARASSRLRIAAERQSEKPSEPATDTPPRPVPDDLTDLDQALRLLPEGQREVLFMRTVQGMSVSEVAEALRVPEGTVKSRLSNALATLRSDPRLRNLFDPT